MKSPRNASAIIILILVLNYLSYYAINCQDQIENANMNNNNGDENCETLKSQVHLIKEEYDDLGRLKRTCNGEVQVNKCEGMCNSQVQPSVITPTGFLKECYCCRESYLRERIITLEHCYDPDGMRLSEEGLQSMDVKLKEPNECKCYKCGDFTR